MNIIQKIINFFKRKPKQSVICGANSTVIQINGEEIKLNRIKAFDANKITLDNWDFILKVRKKPIIVHATQINFPEGFKVNTMEGTMYGKPGDYLMFGIFGEKYICDKNVFEITYDVIGEKNNYGDIDSLTNEMYKEN